MKHVFKTPDLGEGTTQAEIVAWRVKVGDIVREDQPIVDLMTEKATVEVTSPVQGTIVALRGAPGESMPVGSELVVFDVAESRAGDEAAAKEAAATEATLQSIASAIKARIAETPAPETAERAPLASPAARHRAAELGVALASVPGTGPERRVLREDIEAFAAASAPPRAQSDEAVEEIKVIGLRRKIAERMQQAASIPQITYVEEIDVTALEALRRDLNERYANVGARLTLLPFLMRAIVRAVAKFPQCNAHFDAAAGLIRRSRAVHIGLATQTPSGLVVTVARHAEALDLWQAAREVSRLAEAAREARATRDELEGSTITISSLGALGGIVSTPILNAPEVAIVGVNRIVERPCVVASEIAVRKTMNLSSSFDHRVIDGWDAASFVQEIKAGLEQPALLFLGEPG